MRRLRSTHLLFRALIVLMIPASAVVAACGGSDDKESSSAPEGFDSAYCVTARNWAAHELSGDGDAQYASGGPAALRTWWNEQAAYLKNSAEQAPPEIRDAVAVKERAMRVKLTPVLEKYGFDPQQIAAKGTPAEQALAQPNPAEQQAQAAIHAYDDSVCLYGGSPPAAEATFKPSAEAKPYCEAVAMQQQGFEQVASSKVDPEALEAYVTSAGFSAALDRQDATAPPEIAADVKADNEWDRTRKLDVLKGYDYDVRRMLREGSAEDLAVYAYWDPEIREQDSRVTAYLQQVCRLGG